MNNLEKRLGYAFSNLELFTCALTHKSFSENCYERLEFLGDAVLEMVVSSWLYSLKAYDQAQMTRFRQALVSSKPLSSLFDKYNFGEFVKIGKSSKGKISNGMKEDFVEAIIGAVYLDSGYESAEKFVFKLLSLNQFKLKEINNYKSQFQELVQQGGNAKIEYVSVSEKNRLFKESLVLNGKTIAQCSGKSKKDAQMLCAKQGVDLILKRK